MLLASINLLLIYVFHHDLDMIPKYFFFLLGNFFLLIAFTSQCNYLFDIYPNLIYHVTTLAGCTFYSVLAVLLDLYPYSCLKACFFKCLRLDQTFAAQCTLLFLWKLFLLKNHYIIILIINNHFRILMCFLILLI